MERDSCNCLALTFQLDMFLCFNRLVQSVRIPATIHQASCEFIHDDDLAVLDDVILITEEDKMSFQCLVERIKKDRIIQGKQALDFEELFDFLDARFRPNKELFILLVAGEINTLLEILHGFEHLHIHEGVVFCRGGDNQRGSRLINQNGVHFIDDAEIQPLLSLDVVLPYHVVAQVIEAELIVRAIHDVCLITEEAFPFSKRSDNQTCGQSKERVEFSHLFPIATCEVIIDRNNMNLVAVNRVVYRRTSRDERFSFACLHLSDATVVQVQPAEQLYVIMAQSENALRCLADDSKDIREVFFFVFATTFLSFIFVELYRLTEFIVIHVFIFRFKKIDFMDNLLFLFHSCDLTAEQFFDAFYQSLITSS